MRVTDVPETVLACARDLSLLDLVVLVDGVLHADPDRRSALESIAGRRRRGAPRLRAALRLADHRSESPWESMLRVLLTVADIVVEPQHDVTATDGTHVARADLWLVGTTTMAEYDGECHLPRAQQRKDLRRLRRVSGERWTRHGYTSVDLLHRAIGILRDADAAVARDHDPARIRPWHDLLRESAWTPAGRDRLARRWGRSDSAAETVA